ncbi:hypothetical protein [Sulfobacillus thermosulfidooxidans]|uniref:hypothetical protein n=1 Tax=Sulfobacillus thermosulfidooxidans TaxID=28034 RepID=UPI0006B5A4EF|nr:hypothetical protein [Sulfobacillus thermosulfidooxidans]
MNIRTHIQSCLIQWALSNLDPEELQAVIGHALCVWDARDPEEATAFRFRLGWRGRDDHGREWTWGPWLPDEAVRIVEWVPPTPRDVHWRVSSFSVERFYADVLPLFSVWPVFTDAEGHPLSRGWRHRGDAEWMDRLMRWLMDGPAMASEGVPTPCPNA